MKTIIIYDSVFGNTEIIARAMAEALGDVSYAINVNTIATEVMNEVDLIVVGSPTRGFKPTEGISKMLKNLPVGSLKGKKTAAFDTRIPLETIENKLLRGLVKIGGYADKTISHLLQKKGAELLASAGFFVTASEGPLADGEQERAANWIKEIVKS